MMSHVMREDVVLTAAEAAHRSVDLNPATWADHDAAIKVFGQWGYFTEQLATPNPDGNQVYLARRGEELLGTVTIGPLGREELRWLKKRNFVPEHSRLLTHLEVPEAERGKGFGSVIMSKIESVVRAEGFTWMILGVDRANAGARRLYRRLGYKRWRRALVPTTQRHYRDDGSTWETGDRCLVFFKRL